jgi:hypothetical protein
LFRSLCLALLLAAPVGCGPSPAAEAAKTRQAALSSADVAMPPKELLEAVKRAIAAPPLSLGIEQQDRGTLVTGWKRYRGDWHIGRYWQDRTRFRIDISPDFDDPTSRSRLSVVAETEQRAAEGQRWDREPRIPRPQRAQGALKVILDAVGKQQ